MRDHGALFVAVSISQKRFKDSGAEIGAGE
jgi:hypothetical protein